MEVRRRGGDEGEGERGEKKETGWIKRGLARVDGRVGRGKGNQALQKEEVSAEKSR